MLTSMQLVLILLACGWSLALVVAVMIALLSGSRARRADARKVLGYLLNQRQSGPRNR
jgi:hypothetical protein